MSLYEWQCKDGVYQTLFDPGWRWPRVTIGEFLSPRDLGEIQSSRLVPIAPPPPTPYGARPKPVDPASVVPNSLLQSLERVVLYGSQGKLSELVDDSVVTQVDRVVSETGHRETLAKVSGRDQAQDQFEALGNLLGKPSYSNCYLLGPLGVCQFEYPKYDRKLIVDFAAYNGKIVRLRFVYGTAP